MLLNICLMHTGMLPARHVYAEESEWDSSFVPQWTLHNCPSNLQQMGTRACAE